MIVKHLEQRRNFRLCWCGPCLYTLGGSTCYFSVKISCIQPLVYAGFDVGKIVHGHPLIMHQDYHQFVLTMGCQVWGLLDVVLYQEDMFKWEMVTLGDWFPTTRSLSFDIFDFDFLYSVFFDFFLQTIPIVHYSYLLLTIHLVQLLLTLKIGHGEHGMDQRGS